MHDRTFASTTRTVALIWLAIALVVGVSATAAIAKPPPVTKIRLHLADHNVRPDRR